MPYTLAKLKRLVLAHLEIPSDSLKIAAEDLTDAINAARDDVWKDAEGPQGDTFRMDLVASMRDYPLPVSPASISAVSIRRGLMSNGRPMRLKRASLEGILASFSDYPSDGTPFDWPTTWMLRLISHRAGSSMEAEPVGYISGPAISVWPLPVQTVPDGLLIELSAPAAPLAVDTDTSALPDEVDRAAAWKAAMDLAIDYSDDEGIAKRVSILSQRYDAELHRAQMAVIEMDGGITDFQPTDSFYGTTQPAGRAQYSNYTTYPVAQTPIVAGRARWADPITIIPDAGASLVTFSGLYVDLQQVGAITIDTDLGPILDIVVAPDGTSVTGTLANGVTFSGTDRAILRYIKVI